MSAKAKSSAQRKQESLRERIRQAKRRSEQLEVAEWDATVEIRSMSLAQKSEFVEGLEDQTEADMLPTVVILTCFDPETGEALFGEDDREWLRDQDAAVVERVAVEGLRVSSVSVAAALESGKDGS